MKKILIISSFLVGGIFFAQEKKHDLEKTKYKLSITPISTESVTLKEIQKDFIFKKYPAEILKKLIKSAEKNATFF